VRTSKAWLRKFSGIDIRRSDIATKLIRVIDGVIMVIDLCTRLYRENKNKPQNRNPINP